MAYTPYGAFLARRDFGFLKHPVSVEVVGTSYRFRGHYSGLIDGAHRILIRSDYQTPFVLAHELVHALQCERDFDGDHETFFATYNETLRAALDLGPDSKLHLAERVAHDKRVGSTKTRDAYENLSWEREANETALA